MQYNIEQIKREASEYVFKINTPSHSRSDFEIYLHQYIDYLHYRGYFGGVPDGYVLVPKEPTAEMIKCGDDYSEKWFNVCSTGEVYRVMLAAAPKGETK